MRISIGQRPIQSFAAEDDDKPMALAWFDQNFSIANLFDALREQRAQVLSNLRFDSASATVGHDAFCIQGAKIRARCDIARFEGNSQTERLNDSAADLE